jgi:hypothetical protein
MGIPWASILKTGPVRRGVNARTGLKLLILGLTSLGRPLSVGAYCRRIAEWRLAGAFMRSSSAAS